MRKAFRASRPPADSSLVEPRSLCMGEERQGVCNGERRPESRHATWSWERCQASTTAACPLGDQGRGWVERSQVTSLPVPRRTPQRLLEKPLCVYTELFSPPYSAFPCVRSTQRISTRGVEGPGNPPRVKPLGLQKHTMYKGGHLSFVTRTGVWDTTSLVSE